MASIHGLRDLNQRQRKKDVQNSSPQHLEDQIPFVFSMKSDREPIEETIPYTLKLVCCPDLRVCSTSFIYLVAIWLVYIICLLQGVERKNHEVLQVHQETLLNFGGAIGTLISQGQIHRLLTASFLHANLMHILMNSICLLLLCTRFEKLYFKQTPYILLASSITGFLLSVFCNRSALTVGASTALFGILGGFVAYLIINWTALESYSQIRSSLTCTIGVIIFVALLFSIGSSIDAIAHIGGLLGGLFMSLALLPGILPKAAILNYVGVGGFVGMNVLTFGLLMISH